MAHILRLTDGVGTVTLTASPIDWIEYDPLVSADGSDITESGRVKFYSSTQATNYSNIRAVNRLLEQAKNYNQNRSGPRVYVEFDPGASGTVYRSDVYAGSITPYSEVLKYKFFDNETLLMTVQWTRAPFWEGPLTQIPLSNTSATDNTSGLTITNAYDATAENFADIDELAVIGDIPAPLQIELENTKSDADAAKEIYIWHNVYSNPTTLDHILEGEDATGATVSAPVSDATSSSDLYVSLIWTSTDETLIAQWALGETLMTSAAGGRFAFLARWRGAFPYTDMWIRFRLVTATNNNVLWEGQQVLIDDNAELTFIDTGRIGPALVGLTSIQALKLRMYGYRDESGTHTLPIDYLQLSPISGDMGYKRFVCRDDGVAYQEKLVYDDIEGHVYHLNTSSKKIADFSDFGGPILVVPNKDQRLYFNSCDKDDEAKVNQTWKVKAWYRPRRSSL